MLLVLRPNLVLLRTDVLQSYLSVSFASNSASPCLRNTAFFILLRYQKSRGTSHYTALIMIQIVDLGKSKWLEMMYIHHFAWTHRISSFKTSCKVQLSSSWLQNEGVIMIRSTHIIIFTNPSARAGYDTRSIFKRSLTCLNSEFSFS